MHAVRDLVRLGAGVLRGRWTQLGFGRTSSTRAAQATPRNLLGFKDGTADRNAQNESAFERFAWVGDDAGRLAGGSYLVTRRIRMLIEDCNQVPAAEQEAVIGPTTSAGALLGQREELDPTDFAAVHDARPAGRRTVLHRLPAQSRDRLRAGAVQPRRGPAQPVHPRHVLRRVRLPARRARRGRLMGPRALRRLIRGPGT